MDNKFFRFQWDWKVSGLLLGLVFIITVAVIKPIGVSTQFVILDGIMWNAASTDLIVKDESAKKGYASTNAYLNKSGGKYAKSVKEPVNYSFIFVIAMIIGGTLAYFSSRKSSNDSTQLPKSWTDNYGHTSSKRYLAAFLGGVLVLFGARLAGGCSSGHMMSGMMQTSISGYLFAISTFVAAIPVAITLYRK